MKNEKVIDLFAGCGGLSEGFEKAGFKVVGFVENWIPAIETHLLNFPNSKLIGEDIVKISEKDIKKLKVEFGEIDGIIGGPPCQGFSTMGKMDPTDPRNSMFMEFVRFVRILKPKFFLMENVRALLSARNHKQEKVIDIIIKEFEKSGYNVSYKVLRAANYGVPQLRDRLVILGHLDKTPLFPKETHGTGKQDYITIYEAINNLPQLDPLINLGAEEIITKLIPKNDYEKYLLEKSKGKLLNHQIKKQRELDIERAKHIPEGRYIRSITPGGLKNDIFPSKSLHLKESESKQQKYWRLDRNGPSVTILTDWVTMRQKIHYSQNRPFSVRELARLQSFQDHFFFTGKIEEKYKQIGNAVPVLMAEALAKQIRSNLF